MKKLWIFGDSTSVDYSENQENGLQSWAHFFKELLKRVVELEKNTKKNKSGASKKNNAKIFFALFNCF